MSVRAYKVKSIELEGTPTFNLWHSPEEIFTLLHIDQQLGVSGGYISISKEDVENAFEHTRHNDTVPILQAILKDIGEDNYIEYYCY